MTASVSQSTTPRIASMRTDTSASVMVYKSVLARPSQLKPLTVRVSEGNNLPLEKQIAWTASALVTR